MTPAVAERAARLGIKLVDATTNHPAVKILGAPIGSAAAMADWCTERLAATAPMCDALAHDCFDPRLAFTLLRLPPSTFLGPST